MTPLVWLKSLAEGRAVFILHRHFPENMAKASETRKPSMRMHIWLQSKSEPRSPQSPEETEIEEETISGNFKIGRKIPLHWSTRSKRDSVLNAIHGTDFSIREERRAQMRKSTKISKYRK